jgi:hypothetical protein
MLGDEMTPDVGFMALQLASFKGVDWTLSILPRARRNIIASTLSLTFLMMQITGPSWVAGRHKTSQ